MNDRDILQVLQQATTAAVAASSLPTLPIKFLGRNFSIPDDQKWIEPIVIPSGAVEFWGTERNYTGLFRLVLHWPKDDAGAYGPLDVLASVADYFSKARRLQNLEICATAAFAGVIDGGADLLYPANMRFQSFRLS